MREPVARANGTYRTFIIRGAPLRRDDGTASSLYLAATDVQAIVSTRDGIAPSGD